MWRNPWCEGPLRPYVNGKPPYVPLRLTFRFPLRGGLRSLTWLPFRWLTFSMIYSMFSDLLGTNSDLVKMKVLIEKR